MSDDVDPGAHSILIVDDAVANRRLYSWILGRAGFRVHTASDGIDALDQLAHLRPSLVLLDFWMPRLDGIGVLQHLRSGAERMRVPVVMLTSSSCPEDIEKALEAGANDYITKPVNSRLLVTRVRSLIQADQDREQASLSKQAESLRRELEEAHRVQRAQLPTVPATWSDWTIVGAVAPSGQVGGDVFDLVQTADGRLIASVIDVTGHGTASALVAAETRAELRHLLQTNSLLESMELLNNHLACRETGRYSCIAAVELSGTKARILNAGLPPAALVRSGSVVAHVSASGLPIGMFEGGTYQVSELETLPGDRIVLVSDGLTEPFGPIDDVEGALGRLHLLPRGEQPPHPDDLHQAISHATRSSGAGLIDDATALILDRQGPTEATLHIAPRPEAVAAAVEWAVRRSPAWVDRALLDNGITEAVTNAVLHGALELRSSARSDGDYETYLREASSLADSDARRNRVIRLSLLPDPCHFGIRVEWDGAPCPQGARLPPAELGPLQESGMGITIIHALFDRVAWSEDGRAVDLWLACPEG